MHFMLYPAASNGMKKEREKQGGSHFSCDKLLHFFHPLHTLAIYSRTNTHVTINS